MVNVLVLWDRNFYLDIFFRGGFHRIQQSFVTELEVSHAVSPRISITSLSSTSGSREPESLLSCSQQDVTEKYRCDDLSRLLHSSPSHHCLQQQCRQYSLVSIFFQKTTHEIKEEVVSHV